MGGMRPLTSTITNKRFVVDNSVYCFNSKKFSFAHLKPLPFSKKLSNVVYTGNGKLFCYIINRNNEHPQILIYNLNKIYPEFDRYAFSKQKEKWAKEKFRNKISRITPDYNAHPDNRLETIEEVDKVRKGQVRDKRLEKMEQKVMNEGLQEAEDGNKGF